MKRPENIEDIKEWLKRNGIEVDKLDIVRNEYITGYIIYSQGQYGWEEVYKQDYPYLDLSTCTDIEDIIMLYINCGIDIDWETTVKEPKNVLDIYEWLHRQNVIDEYAIEEKESAMGGMGFGMGFNAPLSIYLYFNERVLAKLPINCDNEEDKVRAVSTLIEILIEQGVTPDWK